MCPIQTSSIPCKLSTITVYAPIIYTNITHSPKEGYTSIRMKLHPYLTLAKLHSTQGWQSHWEKNDFSRFMIWDRLGTTEFGNIGKEFL